MTTGKLLVSAWEPAPVVLLVCVAALTIYGTRARPPVTRRTVYFVAAVVLFWLALASPLGVLAGGYLFSAHMAQHLILLLAVPPLALLGLPPGSGEPPGGAPTESPSSRGTARFLAPWIAGVGGMWIWHEQSLCNAAAAGGSIQWLQTASLVGAGLVFWWPIVGPRLKNRFAPFPAILYLFSACLACSVLGILVTFSPIEICSIYAHPTDRLGVLPLLRERWGISPKVDQQLGGLMMWIPACLVYAGAILGILARTYRSEGTSGLATGTHKIAVEVE